MNLHRLLSLTLVLLAATLFAAGCSEDSDPVPTGSSVEDVSGENSLEEIDLNQDYGGLAYTDEAEAFGDELLLAEARAAEDALVLDDDEDDTLDDEPEIVDRPELIRTYLRIVWGKLPGDPSLETDAALTRLVWDGGLRVTGRNVIAVKSTLLFERPFDHLLPRENRQELDWRSVTGPHVDGVLVCVLSLPDDTGAVDGELSFATGPLTQSYRIADLDGLDEVIPVDDLGNGVSFMGTTERPERCAAGFLAGYWQSVPDHSGGYFRGRVLTGDGHLRGYMMGRYGLNDEGERVFAGKIIDREGSILGLMGGAWEPADDGSGLGHFVGRWVNRAGDHRGVLEGRYETLPDAGAGFFHGVWKEICDDAA